MQEGDAADLVVIGTTIDPHISAVLARVQEIAPELSVCRFDIDQFPSRDALEIALSNEGALVTFLSGEQQFQIDESSVVWFRRLGRPRVIDSVGSRYRAWATEEAEQALVGALSVLRPSAWINEYWASRRASIKVFQYAEAMRCGLNLPDTIISNSPASVAKFVGDGQPYIAKSLSRPLISEGEADGPGSYAFTHRIDDISAEGLADIEITPTQVQPLIDADFEVRVASVAGVHRAVAIRATDPVEGRHDWRAVSELCEYEPCDIPKDVESNLGMLMDRLGLDYASSDFIVDHDGVYHFLEANPHGAWLWLEEAVPQFGFTELFALTLLKRVRSA